MVDLFDKSRETPGFQAQLKALIEMHGMPRPPPSPSPPPPDTRQPWELTIGKSPTPEGEGPNYNHLWGRLCRRSQRIREIKVQRARNTSKTWEEDLPKIPSNKTRKGMSKISKKSASNTAQKPKREMKAKTQRKPPPNSTQKPKRTKKAKGQKK